MTEYTPGFEHQREPDSIPIVEGWVGSWRISLRRRSYDRDELRMMYDAHAEDWESDLSALQVPSAYAQLHDVFFKDVAPVRTGTLQVLDCGIGTGAFSTALSKASPEPFALCGIDLSPMMLDKARSRLTRQEVNAELRVADAKHIPYPDNHFDLVVSAHMLEHLAEPEAALSEMNRVLKPGGKMLICLTRKSLFGRHIQFKWRTHTVTESIVNSWMRDIPFSDIRFLTVNTQPAFNNRSLAFSARKAAQTTNGETYENEQSILG
jgi:demethylmenaquinone methyltransferase/2-methoxy-6-polyprenyl-1,4-benzoquinol methylase